MPSHSGSNSNATKGTDSDKRDNSQRPTYRSLVNQATELLYDGSDSPRIDSEVLLQHATQQSLAWYIAYGDCLASAQHTKDYFELIAQRQHGLPIAYILGYKEFWSLKFNVNEHVLIPRADTETLVEQALICLQKKPHATVLDLGTGSGAIAITIAKECPNAKVIAADLHENALAVAEKNAQLNLQSNQDDSKLNISFIKSNWFDGFEGQQFDLITSNPPYVSSSDPHLKQGDLRFEPITALSSGEDGYDDLTIIISNASKHLNDHGWLLLEHGFEQQAITEQLLQTAGFTNISLHYDLNNLPRCTAAQWLDN